MIVNQGSIMIATGNVRFRVNKRLVPGVITHVPAEGRSKGRYEISFGYNDALRLELKAMEGTKWHGYDDNPRKIWSVSDTNRNRFQLSYLLGNNVYAPYDCDLQPYESKRTLYAHQVVGVQHCITRRHCILAAEMGCVDGSAIVHLNRAGKGFSLTLEKLYYKWRGGTDNGRMWDRSIPTYIRSLCGDTFRLNRINDVLFKGYKIVYNLITKSGKQVALTDDHEVCVGNDKYVALKDLKIGDKVISNGKWIDKDGYVRVGGYKGLHPRWTTGGVYEHILVMEDKIGRYLELNEVVHHINEIKHDNRPENLELKTDTSHKSLHGLTNYKNLHNGDKVQFLPYEDEIIKIEEVGYRRVYDIVCQDPYRNFVANGITVHNCGKTLVAIEVMEWLPFDDQWWWVGPKSALVAVQLEFGKWKAKRWPKFLTYEALIKEVENWPDGKKAPRGIVFDECSKIKNAVAQRSKAAKHIADSIRDDWGRDSAIILMSGTPAPKNPVDWWHLAEVACPGFLKEGTPQKFQYRLALIVKADGFDGNQYPKLKTWYDNEDKCKVCGEFEHNNLEHDLSEGLPNYHPYEKSVNEVAGLYRRLKGLALVQFKKDCLDLPEKIFHRVRLKPSDELLRAMELIIASSPSTIEALTRCRELSDGFQYIKTESGEALCPTCHGTQLVDEFFDEADPDTPLTKEEIAEGKRIEYNDEGVRVGVANHPFVRGTRKIACTECREGKVPTYTRSTEEIHSPKEDALADLLDQYEDEGRAVVWAGFEGSIKKCIRVVINAGWQYIKLDGKGWESSLPGGATELMRTFDDRTNGLKIAFIGQQGAGGMGLNMTASSMAVYYSNTFKWEDRAQSMDRIHRPGADHNRGCSIFDLCLLPTDDKVIDNLDNKRDLMHMSMGMLRHEMQQKIVERTM